MAGVHRDRRGATSVDPTIIRLIEHLSPGADVDLVWTNPLGGRTFRIRGGGGIEYLKIAGTGVPETHDPVREAEQLQWVGTRLPVPEVVDVGRTDEFTWMRTREVGGVPASDPRWLEDPKRTARLLGEATRQFHDALTNAVETCPFSWRVTDRLRRGAFSDAAHEKGAEAPEENDLTVAHGDMCAPNILLTRNGDVGGFLDLGTMGVADRAADLGSQLWSLELNGMAGFFGEFLAAYGYAGDVEKVRWYRDLYATV